MDLLNRACATRDINYILSECKNYNMNKFGLFLATMYSNTEMCDYFQDDMEVYPKESNNITVKLLCNWTTSENIQRLWNKMKPTHIPIEFTDTNPNYWIIINAPPSGEYYIPERTIVFQMEPHMSSHPEQWGEWSSPDASKFFKVFAHGTDYNNIEWHLSTDYNTLMNLSIQKSHVLSTVLSDKYSDPGHIKRVDFVKFIENNIDIDVYGNNKFNYKRYCGALPYHNKDGALFKYKYHFNAENHSITNYFTEKIIDAIMAECLCFYWGCPNITRYIDPRAYIILDLNDIPKSMEIVKNAIENNEWEKRIDIIRSEKNKIINQMNFFTRIYNLINTDNFTVVTGFFNIGRENWTTRYSRSIDVYLKYFENFLKFNVNMVIFIEPEYKQFVENIRKTIDKNTTIVNMNIEDLYMYKYLDRIRSIQSSPEYISKHPNPSAPEVCEPMYNIVVLSKMEMMNKATKLVDANYFIWLDAGYTHGSVNMSEIKWNPTMLFKHRDKLSIMTLRSMSDASDNPVDFFNQYIDVISGGFFSGSCDIIEKVSTYYYELIDEIFQKYNIVDDDQFYNTMLIKKYPDLFNLIPGSWYGAIYFK